MNQLEWWWPHPESIKFELQVEVEGNEITLSATDGTECGEWIREFSSSEEGMAVFRENFLGAVRRGCERVMNEEIPDDHIDGTYNSL